VDGGALANGSTGQAVSHPLLEGQGFNFSDDPCITGNGPYYVIIKIIESDDNPSYFISKATISFESASTTVAYSISAFDD
jgi:hypothetical protein